MYVTLAYVSGSVMTGVILYFFLDLVVVEAVIKHGYNLEPVGSGLDSYMVQNSINTLFYVVMDRRIDNVKEIKK